LRQGYLPAAAAAAAAVATYQDCHTRRQSLQLLRPLQQRRPLLSLLQTRLCLLSLHCLRLATSRVLRLQQPPQQLLLPSQLQQQPVMWLQASHLYYQD
jgi:hypothetical protein